MSLDEAALFDAWRGRAPRADFGDLRDVGPDFDSYAERVCAQLSQSFGVALELGPEAPRVLDSIIDSMWASGWSPSSSSLVNFTRDLGVVLAASLHRTLQGRLVSRGDTAPMHLSLWWQEQGLEAFPGHVVAKRLIHQDVETSIQWFAESVKLQLN